MSNSFIISDTHFLHKNSWEKFKNSKGTSLRPFTSTEEMDETMVENWNKVVRPGDHVYHLGDVAISKKGLQFISRLNGKKRLIAGNHDIFANEDYFKAGFQKIAGVRVFVDQFILSHIPLHPECVSERFKYNVHGHLHQNHLNDPKYLCVSVEQINYTPISFDEVKERLKKNEEAFADTGRVIDFYHY